MPFYVNRKWLVCERERWKFHYAFNKWKKKQKIILLSLRFELRTFRVWSGRDHHYTTRALCLYKFHDQKHTRTKYDFIFHFIPYTPCSRKWNKKNFYYVLECWVNEKQLIELHNRLKIVQWKTFYRPSNFSPNHNLKFYELSFIRLLPSPWTRLVCLFGILGETTIAFVV